jgi:hypothetical protein
MAPTKRQDSLQVVAPQSIDEESPLLGNANHRTDDPEALEAQAEQERREYEVGAVPLAEEPSNRKLLLIMSTLWCCVSYTRCTRVLAFP